MNGFQLFEPVSHANVFELGW